MSEESPEPTYACKLEISELIVWFDIITVPSLCVNWKLFAVPAAKRILSPLTDNTSVRNIFAMLVYTTGRGAWELFF